jgi:hypothetical protein
LVIANAGVGAQQKVAAIDLAHVQPPAAAAGGHHLQRVDQPGRYTQVGGHRVACATGQDANRDILPHQTVDDLHQRAVAAIADNQIIAGLDRLPGQFGRVARAVGDQRLPLNVVLGKDVVDRVQNRFIVAGGGVDDDGHIAEGGCHTG